MNRKQAAKVERLAEVFSATMFINDHDYLLIRPKRKYTDPMVFDRAICKAGLKAFVRPTFSNEHYDIPSLEIQRQMESPYVLVQELRPGLRSRTPINL